MENDKENKKNKELQKNMENEYRISKFNIKNAQPNRTWLLIGARNTGKTVLLQDILYHMQHKIDFCLAMTATVSTVQAFSKFMPKSLIYKNGYDYEAADNFLKSSKTVAEKNKVRNSALILDDCMFDSKVMKSKTQTDLHLNGRHYNTSIFNTTQYCMVLPTIIRGNIDYVVCLKEPIKSVRKKLYEYFFGVFPSFSDFEKVFNKCTDNYGAIVLDKTGKSVNVENMVSWYKANPNLPDFKLCKPIFFQLAREARENKQAKQKLQNQKIIKTIKK
jgi:hypothetical protein